ncbi:acyl carrier protein [Bacteroidales bacterium OttesenSCG-928-L03]|nr:acyl carrier protein [Bacteroidales bacterium OttesenSCG-928-L03]
MELNAFIQNLANQFEETEMSEFDAQTNFKELDEWSSLVALSVIAMVDEEYGVTLKGDDIRNSQTIEDLYNTIKSRI